MEFSHLPNDIIRVIVTNFSFAQLINFSNINQNYRKLTKSTRWHHIELRNFRYLIVGYNFARCRFAIDPYDRYDAMSVDVYNSSIKRLSLCTNVELCYTIITLLIVHALSKVPEVKFGRCIFTMVHKNIFMQLSNVKSLSFEYCLLGPLIRCVGNFNIDEFICDNISDEALRNLTNAKRIQLSSVGRNYRYTETGLMNLTSIEEIDIYDSIPLNYLMKLVNARKVNLFNHISITNDDLDKLHNIPIINTFNCEKLTSGNCKANVYNISDLVSRKLSDPTIVRKIQSLPFADNYCLIPMIHVENINKLQLYHCHQITDDDIKWLKNVPILRIDTCRNVTNESLKYLTRTETLVMRNLANITDHGLWYLRNNQELELSTFDNITDDGLVHLRNIRYLTLDFCYKITDSGYKHLTNVLKLRLKKQPITNQGLKYLANIKILILSFCPTITDNGFGCLNSVYSISIHFCPKVTDRCFEYMNNSAISLVKHATITDNRKQELERTFQGIEIKVNGTMVNYLLIKIDPFNVW